jgi:hypothetical protein
MSKHTRKVILDLVDRVVRLELNLQTAQRTNSELGRRLEEQTHVLNNSRQLVVPQAFDSILQAISDALQGCAGKEIDRKAGIKTIARAVLKGDIQTVLVEYVKLLSDGLQPAEFEWALEQVMLGHSVAGAEDPEPTQKPGEKEYPG